MKLRVMAEILYSDSKIVQWARLGSRAVYGQTLMELAETNSSIIAMSADLGNSSGLDRFKNTFPQRFVNVGIAEQNMIGVAAGMAKEGFTVFASSFAPFIAFRAGEQIRMNMGYMEHNIKAVGIGSGLSMGFLGNSHFGTEDLSVLLSIPNLTVISPADTTEVVKAVSAAALNLGPVYLRLTGAPGDPLVNLHDYEYEIGKAINLREGKDVSLIATGSMVALAVEVANKLSELGISASVTNMHTLKPLDLNVLDALNEKGVPIYTLEEHSIIGGLGSSVASYLSTKQNNVTIRKIGLPDAYCETGDYVYLKQLHGLDKESVARKIQKEVHQERED
jgi:transketolase